VELPGTRVVVVLELGEPIRVYDRAQRPGRHRGGFVAGLDDAPSLTEHDGSQRGLEVSLTPQGARLFFGVPLSELFGRVVAFPDLVPREQRDLVSRLHDLPDWDARFDEFERILEKRVADARVGRDVDAVAWAVRRIEARGGDVDIGALGRELGVSHRRLIALFRDGVGMAPKLFARLVRFDRVMARLRSGQTPLWIDLAAELGYADQSHLIREVKRFTGVSPTQAHAMFDELARACAP
jgi:AraC-like DNA-binding protein